MEHAKDYPDAARYSAAPQYNIQAVENATGLLAGTLRSWERRYGMPAPHRDTHGRRLYSDWDIAVIRWLMDQVRQGVAISRAVAMLPVAAELKAGHPRPQFDKLQLQLLQAIDWMDEEEMRRVLSEAMQLTSPEAVVLELIQPVLTRMGELWEAGHLSVASEHFGTNILRSALADLFRLGPKPSRPQRILVGCAPGELHDVGALVFALFLRRAGFLVTYLGASVASEGMPADLQRLRPSALCLSATTPGAVDALGALYKTLNCTFGGVLAYGGMAFNADSEPGANIPGIFLGSDVREAVRTLDAAL